jgi:hypothetical protein
MSEGTLLGGATWEESWLLTCGSPLQFPDTALKLLNAFDESMYRLVVSVAMID